MNKLLQNPPASEPE